jgi:uncharacterized membrane protein
VTLPPPPGFDPFLPPPTAATNTSATNSSATIAFVLALLGLVFTPVVDVAAVIVGHHALATIRRTGEQGAGLAKAALVIGYSLIGLGVLVVAFVVAVRVGSIAQ